MDFKTTRILYHSCTILAILLLVRSTHQTINNNEVDDGESNPLFDIASSFLQNAMNNNNNGGQGNGLAALGGLLGGLMQGNNGKNLGDMLMGMQGGGDNAAGDVLSSLGSLITNKDGNLDPNILNSVIGAFADSASSSSNSNSNPNTNRGETGERPATKRQASKQGEAAPEFDINSMLNLASAFMGQQQQGGGSSQGGGSDFNIASALPLILNAFNAFSGPVAEERAHKHDGHAAFLPPVIEKMHVFWDHFINSELGAALWQNLGLSEMTKSFVDEKGNVDFETVLRSLENHSFRRRWIKTATNYMSEWIIHLSNPEVQQRYMTSGQFMLNGFLKSQGFPKYAMFQPNKVAESLSNIINYVMAKYLNMAQDVTIYVKPAVNYVKDLIKSTQKHGSYLQKVDRNELSDKLTDTLNLEIIEPILRVYRAYRFAIKSPQCQTHVLCVINRHDPKEKLGLPGFKVGLTKFSSLVASAALSYQGGHGFWDLYNAVHDDQNCMAKYPAFCDEWHEQEINVTTEYYHNEL